MWYGTVTECVRKETLSYLMECPITSTVFQINMDWRTVVGICRIFFTRVLLLISVRIPSKNWHKSSRDPRVKYRQSHEKVWQLTNGVNQSESQTSLDNSSPCNDCETVVKPHESDCEFEKWNCKLASYFRFMRFLQYMRSF